MVAVRPDWTNPDPLLGYEDGLSEVISGERAWHVPQALEFMLQAAAHPNEPYLLLLDEMNLAHVERYFADVLSGMESGHPVLPNLARQQGEWRLVDVGVPRLPLPANLFIVGTVNVDETTYMFSPKVLDRANTIEFRVHTDELMFPAASNRPIASAPAALKAALLAAATEPVRPTAVGERMADWLRTLHSELSKYGREFGHRTFAESIRFAELLVQAGENDAEVAFDLQVLQKVLPKYHGSIRELGAALNALGARCFTGVGATAPDADFDPITADAGAAALPLSFDKVKRMAERLRANHFVSFAE
jgi:5-methylcytosine-specific restriction protein B